ncbi:unnamed protein product [Mortierella alpina]
MQIPLLEAIADHPTPPRSLKFRDSTIDWMSWKILWRACARAEHLTLEDLWHPPEDTPPTTDPRCEIDMLDFSRVRSLTLSYLDVPVSTQLGLVARCKQLECLKWDPDLDWILSPTSSPAVKLADLVSTGCWRHIKRLHWNSEDTNIGDEDLATILDSINVTDDGSSMTGVNGGAQLQELMLIPQGFVVFHGSLFWSRDLLEGKFARPWACSARLKAITLRIAIDATTEEQRLLHNRAMLAQLGKMTSLETLNLSTPNIEDLPESPNVCELSLRLEHGLDSLRGLRKLIAVDFIDANDFDKEEREWVALYFEGVEYTWARHAMY